MWRRDRLKRFLSHRHEQEFDPLARRHVTTYEYGQCRWIAKTRVAATRMPGLIDDSRFCSDSATCLQIEDRRDHDAYWIARWREMCVSLLALTPMMAAVVSRGLAGFLFKLPAEEVDVCIAEHRGDFFKG